VPTSATVVLVDSAGERTFLHLPGANGQLRREELDNDVLFSGRALHVGGALVMPELDGSPTAAVLEEAKARGLTTSLDTVWDATGRWDRLLPSLPHLDVFVPSLAEGSAISGLPEPESVAAWLRERGVGTVALKLGADGCFVSSDEFEGFVAAPAVEALDSTGAGDAFAAGVVYGYLAGWPLERTAALANAAGALAATAVGAVEGMLGLQETVDLAGLESVG
jgi:sugar/nucleoside kinase (ribokinase family)